jgi:cytochrome c peroxidase
MPKQYLVAPVLAAVLTASAAAAFDPAGFSPLPPQPPIPTDNVMTPAKIELGKQLYFDPRLSFDGTLSCNSCHNVMAGGDDDRATSAGIRGQRGGRNAPTVWNAAYLTVQFWDGREPSLEGQAKGPVINPIEMGMPDHAVAIARLRTIPGYVQAFADTFGGGNAALSIDNVAKAIAAYERTLITPGDPFDRFLAGDKKAISKDAIAGAELFRSVGCIACHSGGAFAGPDALPMGAGFFQKFPTFAKSPYVAQYDLASDLGRFDVTKAETDKHMFRVPTLRNIALTAPYFHNGSVATLDEAVRVMASTQLDRKLSDKDVKRLVAFLEALTGPMPEQALPRLPEVSGRSAVDQK